jgi:hypothetical protein
MIKFTNGKPIAMTVSSEGKQDAVLTDGKKVPCTGTYLECGMNLLRT